jgi:NADPH:quinone reductase-like Zn-dependent oxidoreductase
VHAVTVTDGHIAWVQRPDPRPNFDELLVAVKAAALNGADIKGRARVAMPTLPGVERADIPGLELAGEVVAIGSAVSRFSVGDRVMALATDAQAELAVVDERLAVAVPESVSWSTAGGFLEVFATAHDALFTQCELAVGERVLVHGAAGGVGIAAVQLAAVAGAQVVATVRRPEARPLVAAVPPAGTIVDVVAPDDFVERGPFDVVLEMVGASNIVSDVAALATGGRISLIGVSASAGFEVDVTALFEALKFHRGRMHGSMIAARVDRDLAAQAVRAVEDDVVPLLEAGRVRVPIAAEYPMANAEAAYDEFEAGGKVGKLVLTL